MIDLIARRWRFTGWVAAGVTLAGPVEFPVAGAAAFAGGPCEPAWTALAEEGFGNLVQTVGVFNGELYVGGDFTMAGGKPANRIARWDAASQSWAPLGEGCSGSVRALAVFDDGSGRGPALYVGGVFASAGGVEGTSRIARWDGEEWSALGTGMNSTVFSLHVHDDGGGPALYAGGIFTTAGGVEANRIARWSGPLAGWSPVGLGMNNFVFALETWDDPTDPDAGPELYAGGNFIMADELPAERIAKWDGLAWTEVGGGVGTGVNSVLALTVFDDGSGDGEALFLGGSFTSAAGVPINRLAKWNGTSFSPLGSGTDAQVNGLRVFDDGSGPALYAGGLFNVAGGLPGTQGIARWHGPAGGWSSVGGGANNWVISMAVFDDGGGPALYAGGQFTEIGEIAAERIARWGCPPAAPGIPGDLTGDGTVGVDDLLILLAEWGECDDPADCPADLTGDGSVGVDDLLILLANWG